MSEPEFKINPLNDLLFKKMLASEDQKPVMQGFIKDFFDIDASLDDIILVTPYSIKSYKEYLRKNNENDTVKLDDSAEMIRIMRETHRDITVVVKTADLLVELQIYNDKYFVVRTIYYLCERFCSNYNTPGKMETNKDGKPIRYSSLRPVYAMNIVKKKYFDQDDDALHIFSLYDKEHALSLSKEYILLGYFELHKKKVKNSNQGHWQRLFLTGETLDNAPCYIKQAKALIKYENLDEDEREMISSLEKAEATYESIMFTIYEEGRDEGRDEGIEIGMDKGKNLQAIQDAVNAIKKWHCTLDEAMEFVKLKSEYREDMVAELKKQNIEFKENAET